jgi:F0F1-type ATP synthase assembly protein I
MEPPTPDEPEPTPSEEQGLGPGAVAFLTLGVAWACLLVGGGVLGALLDTWAHTAPLFTLLGVAFGIAVAVAMTVVRIRKYL